MEGLTPLVSAAWLKKNLARVVSIDCTWQVSSSGDALPKGYIPGAARFDLAEIKALALAEQTDQVIAECLSKIGVSADDVIIVYDRIGLFSAPRLWWLLMTLGHENLAVLDGGLPAWIDNGGAVEDEPIMRSPSEYKLKPARLCGTQIGDILTAVNDGKQIVDARSADRFYGRVAEPRAGLRSGHIPGSLNLPFSALQRGGKLLPKTELAEAIGKAGIDLSRPIITSCGSGVTAAGLALIFSALGKTDLSVYTGSWAEYGASDYPVQT